MSEIRKMWDKIREQISFYWKYEKSLILKAGIIAFAFIVVCGILIVDKISDKNEAASENSDRQLISVEEGSDDVAGDASDASGNILEADEPALIYIDIAGAVTSPGVVTLPEGSRVFEAIDAAGGLLPSADVSNINQAGMLYDGDFIRIPAEEDDSGAQGSSLAVSSDSRININKATEDELTELTGIGPQTAAKIIEYRKENGRFNSVDDLQNVNGIGKKKLDKIRDRLTV